jgi:hypothetical protein
VVDCPEQQAASDNEGNAARDQPALEVNKAERAREGLGFGHESLADSEGLGQHGEQDGLVAAQKEQAGEEERVDIERDPAQGHAVQR